MLTINRHARGGTLLVDLWHHVPIGTLRHFRHFRGEAGSVEPPSRLPWPGVLAVSYNAGGSPSTQADALPSLAGCCGR